MKFAGSVLILLSALAAGFAYLGTRKNMLEITEQLIFALSLIHSELATKNSCTVEILSLLTRECKGKVYDFFKKTESGMQNLGEMNFQEIWCNSAETELAELEKSSFDAIIELGTVFGKYETEEQLNSLGLTSEKLKLSLEKQQNEYPSVKKLSMGLPPAAALLLIVILL